MAFSPDGAVVLSSSDDETLRLWDAATGLLLWRFECPFGSALAVAFAPGGRQVLLGCEDRSVRLLDVPV